MWPAWWLLFWLFFYISESFFFIPVKLFCLNWFPTASHLPCSLLDSGDSRRCRLQFDGPGHHAGDLCSGQSRTPQARPGDQRTSEARERLRPRWLCAHSWVVHSCCCEPDFNQHVSLLFAPADAMNLCLSLITHSLEDTAFYILKTFPTLQSDNDGNDTPSQGNFFLRHCVTMETVSQSGAATLLCRHSCSGHNWMIWMMLLKCVFMCVCVPPAATGEVGRLLQRTAGGKSALCTAQLHSVLCPGGQEDRYCQLLAIISIFFLFLHNMWLNL